MEYYKCSVCGAIHPIKKSIIRLMVIRVKSLSMFIVV